MRIIKKEGKQMYGYIYMTTNLINNKIYIGQHKSKLYNPKYLGSGKLIRRAIEKYGKENFKNELIDTAETLEELCEKEIYWIKEKKALQVQGNYNILKGGQFGDVTYGLSQEEYKKYCDKLKGKNNPMYKSGERGIHPKGMLGKHHKDETKKRISQATRGKNNPMYNISPHSFKNGHPRGMKGKHHPEGTTWRHSKTIKIILPNKVEIISNNLNKFCKEYNIPRSVVEKSLSTGEEYIARGSAIKTHSQYNGLRAYEISKDNTEIT